MICFDSQTRNNRLNFSFLRPNQQMLNCNVSFNNVVLENFSHIGNIIDRKSKQFRKTSIFDEKKAFSVQETS